MKIRLAATSSALRNSKNEPMKSKFILNEKMHFE